jgi:hypothetical protein
MPVHSSTDIHTTAREPSRTIVMNFTGPEQENQRVEGIALPILQVSTEVYKWKECTENNGKRRAAATINRQATPNGSRLITEPSSEQQPGSSKRCICMGVDVLWVEK